MMQIVKPYQDVNVSHQHRKVYEEGDKTQDKTRC